MSKKQIINPLIRFRQKAQGKYANRVSGAEYARATTSDEAKCFYIVSAEIGNPDPEQIRVCFNVPYDQVTCTNIANWAFFTNERGPFNVQESIGPDGANCHAWLVQYTAENQNGAQPDETVRLTYTPGTCSKDGEAGNADCTLEAYTNYLVTNSILGYSTLRIGDVSADALLAVFPVRMSTTGNNGNWVIRVNGTPVVGWTNEITPNGYIRFNLPAAVSAGDTVTLTNSFSFSDTSATGEDGRRVYKFYNAAVVNVVGQNYWIREDAGAWVTESVGRWQLGTTVSEIRDFTIGSTGSLVGFRPSDHPTSQFGGLVPDTVDGVRVWQLTANVSTNIIVLNLGVGGGTQLPGISDVTLQVDGIISSTVVSWSGARYEVVDSELTTHLQANVGNTLDLIVTT